MKDEIKHVWHFNRPPKEVWEYLTIPELLEQWLCKMDFKPVVGHKFEVPTKAGGTTMCEVTEVIPLKMLSYSWQFPSVKSKKTYDSKVVWTLVPTNDGTELYLVHNGFTILDDYIAHENGWTTLGGRLLKLMNVN